MAIGFSSLCWLDRVWDHQSNYRAWPPENLSLRASVRARFNLMTRHVGSQVRLPGHAINGQGIRLLGKLPDRNNHTHGQERVNNRFHDPSALLFRPNQERVCRFMFVHNMPDVLFL
jgi:hypothetical protein